MIQKKILFLLIWLLSCATVTFAQDADTSDQDPGQEGNPSEVAQVLPKINVMHYKLQKWPKVERLDSTRFSDHVFMQIGGGITGFQNNHIWNSPDKIGFNGSVSIGKWFTPVYGARIGVDFSSIKTVYQDQYPDKTHSLVGGFGDLMLDFTSLADMKYVYNRPVRFGMYFGGGLYQSSIGDTSAWVPGFRTGMMLNIRMSDAMSFFVEPGLTFYGDAADMQSNWRKFDISPSVRIGVNYRVLPIERRIYNGQFTNERTLDNFFLTMGAGARALIPHADHEMQLTQSMGPVAMVGFGKWFTPSSAVRFTLNGGVMDWRKRSQMPGIDNTGSNSRLSYMGAQLDYMLNTSAVFGGYNPESPFSMYMVLGANATLPEKSDYTKLSFGGGVGVQMVMNLSRNTDIFLEPRVNVFTKDYAGGFTSENSDVAPQLMLGINYYPRLGDQRRKGVYKPDGNDHWFYNAGIGVMAPYTNNFGSVTEIVNPMATVGIGKWFGPYSGFKTALSIGLLAEGKGEDTKLGTAGLYYVMNVTNVLKGYKQFNRFEVIGSVGPELVYNTGVNRDEDTFQPGFLFGFSGSLMGMINVSNRVCLYIEPKLGIYQNKLVAGSVPILNSDMIGTISAGMVYRPQPRILTETESRVGKSTISDNWFFTGGAGIASALTSTTIRLNKKDLLKQPTAVIGAGKWFNQVSALKLEGKASIIAEGYSNNSLVRTKLLGLGAYYNMNLTNLLLGFNGTYNRAELVGSIGPEIYYNSGSRHEKATTFGGASAGLQGILNFSEHFGLYIEPRVGVYSDKLNRGSIGNLKKDMIASLTAGIVWKMTDYNIVHQKEQFNSAVNNRLFTEVAVGMQSIVNSSIGAWEPRPAGQVSIGRQYSPISTWRLSGRIELPKSIYRPTNITTGSSYIRHGELEFDYMMSVPHLVSGYKPYRWFDVKPYIGASFGMSAQDAVVNYFPGIHAGIQASVNFSKWISLFVEPKLSAYTSDYEIYGHRDFDVTASGYAGFRYNFKNGESWKENKERAEYGRFIQIGYGGGFFMRTVSDRDHRATLNGEIGFGRWYNAIFGSRLGFYNSRISFKPREDESHFNMDLYSFHLDAMLNVSNLMSGVDKTRLLDLYAFIGPSLEMTKMRNKTQYTAAGNVGVQIMVNCSQKWGVYLEPMGSIYSDMVDMGKSRQGFEAGAKLTLGTVYRFK